MGFRLKAKERKVKSTQVFEYSFLNIQSVLKAKGAATNMSGYILSFHISDILSHSRTQNNIPEGGLHYQKNM